MTHTTHPEPRHTPEVPPLSSADVLSLVGSALIAILGFVTSFAAVSEAMAADFGALAPLVPLGVDAGILVSSVAYIRLARRGEAPPWLPWLPRVLTAATIYLNVAAGDTLAGSVAHAVMVSLWAVAVETAAFVAKRRLGLETGARMDRIRWSRWVLAPRSTFALWRRMVLWEVTSYRTALDLERNRLLAIAELRRKYPGRRWRQQLPPRQRVLLRMGALSPAEVEPQDSAGRVPHPEPAAAEPAVTGSATAVPQLPPAAPPAASARPPRGSARKDRQTPPAEERGVGAMRKFWDAERAAGRTPTGAQLAEVGKVSSRFGRDKAREWKAEAEAPEAPRLHAIGGGTSS